MAFQVSRLSRLPLSLWCAFFMSLAVAILVLAAPMWQLERGVQLIGLDDLIPGAEPPLGHKARLLLAVLASVATAVAILLPFLLLRLVKPRSKKRPFSPQTLVTPNHEKRSVAVADTDASPSRRPIFADKELGAPLMSEAALARVSVFAETPFLAPSEVAAPAVAPAAQHIAQPVQTLAASSSDVAPVREAEVPVLRAADVAPHDREPASAPAFSHAESLSLPLSEMIARLERGLANRQLTPPPPPPATAVPASPMQRVDAQPIAAPLSVVPRRAAPVDIEQGQTDQLLSEAMSKLSLLVGNQR